MRTRLGQWTCATALLALAACSGGGERGGSDSGGGGGGGGGGSGGLPGGTENIALLRDTWGVPHVFALSDEAAFYGLGWAAAEDRLFQMLQSRLMVQGRVAEFFGPGFVPGQGDLNVEHDLRMRQLGWWRRAIEAAAALDEETYALLDAYARGVSDSMSRPGAVQHPLIAQYDLPLDPWQVEDCIGVWFRFSQHFGPEGEEEVALLRKWEELLETLPQEQALEEMLGGIVCDDSAAVVQQDEVPAATQQALADYAALHGLDSPGHCPIPLPSPKFSQAWVVSGGRSTTGRAVLVSDARVEVARPSLYYEWSVEGSTFSARGIGVAGSPILLIGSTAHTAWGATAVGMDQADLFELSVDPGGHPGQYLVDGQWRDFEVDEIEDVLVQGQPSRQVHYRETLWGPVITPLLDAALPGEEFAVRRVPFRDATRNTAVGALRMLRARDLDELHGALSEWGFPSMNTVLADASGRIGYAVAGDIPVRPGGNVLSGVIPQDGSVSANDWLEILPHGLEPHLLDPAAGAVHSANHMPIGSWYPIPVRFGTGGVGHTLRSRRLSELLGALPASVTPQQVEAPRLDAVNTARRDLCELGLWLRDSQTSFQLSSGAVNALAVLEPWWLAGAEMDEAQLGSVLAWHMPTGFHANQASKVLIDAYGGGENGLAFFLASALAAIDGGTGLTWDESDYVDRVLSEAWSEASQIGPGTTWPGWYSGNVLTFDLVSWKNLEGLPAPLGSAPPVSIGPVPNADPDTLSSRPEQSYTQVVQPGAATVARSLLAPGASELVGAHDLDQVPMWEGDGTKPSPRTLAEIQASGPYTVTTLTFTDQP